MKKNRPLPLYNSDTPPKNQNQNPSTQTSENKTPYLKAILSGTTKKFSPENNSPLINSDRIAALRYIKESAFIKRIHIDKMSC